MSNPHDESLINPLPPVVVVLALLLFGIEVFLTLGGRGLIGGPDAVGWRLEAIQRFAFSGDILDWMLANGIYPPDQLIRFVTYPLIHVSFTQMIFVVVFLLALGKMAGEVFSWWAVLLIFFGASIVGALAYGLLLNEGVPLVGGYPAVYGLIGSFTFLMWVDLAVQGANKYRAFSLIAMLLGIQLIFGILFGGARDWVADFAGFLTGFGLSFVLVPGGWQRVLAVVRRR
ncbi:MAG: rhomboid family intramembrane serine protease [Pseudoruegeria sp.]